MYEMNEQERKELEDALNETLNLYFPDNDDMNGDDFNNYRHTERTTHSEVIPAPWDDMGQDMVVTVDSKTGEIIPEVYEITIDAEIMLAIDLLWQNVDSDDYDADATENDFELKLRKKLLEFGIDARISWSNVVHSVIECERDIYEIVQTAINEIEPEYVEIAE